MDKNDKYYFKELRKLLKDELTKSRYDHTLGVEFTAASLAMAHGSDLFSAELAGLLHDCAKCIPDDEKYALCEKYQVALNPSELANPMLVHGKLGAFLCKYTYGVTEPEIISAIAYHTTGRPNMSVLEKIVYVADYIEPRRDKAPNLELIRKTAFSDLDEAVYLIAKDTYAYIQTDNSLAIDPLTNETYEYYKQIHNQKCVK
jgi:predicted HD superfamily hydrolase involved in NAD metabolism